MSSARVLVLSNTRPSRSWRFARRIVSEAPGVEICGIVQRPVSELPAVQQLIATDGLGTPALARGLVAKVKLSVRSWFDSVIHGVLWFVHGCPRTLSDASVFTVEALAEKCSQVDCPFLEVGSLNEKAVGDFILGVRPDLIVALGEVPSLPVSSLVPAKGWLRARENEFRSSTGNVADGLHIRIEHASDQSGSPQSLASLTLPRQAFDTAVGFALKADLVIDDMLSHAMAGMRAGSPRQASMEVAQWTEDILSPYLTQIGPSRVATQHRPSSRRWVRSLWSLSAETALLCSPAVVVRNWMRHLRHRYPVLILAHHLISDRGHRMSISTETFWRQVRFLRRHYRIVSLSEAVEILRSGSVHTPTVSLTFDDGYADNFVSLRAVAEETGIPVSMFVTTGPVELHTEFQHDLSKGHRGSFPMTWDQIRYWKARGAEFGSHTRTHVKCGFVDQVILRDEIVGSKADFESRLGVAPEFFAFPYGNRENMPAEAVKLAASAYPYFLSSFGGENFPDSAGGNCHLVRKKSYAEPWELELELQSVFDFVETTKRALHVAPAPPPKVFEPANAAPLPAALDRARPFDQPANQLVSEPPQNRPAAREA
jgi:peptidoglycan/xylan/chitin deacetylase (PgdA/CDA1 family)